MAPVAVTAAMLASSSQWMTSDAANAWRAKAAAISYRRCGTDGRGHLVIGHQQDLDAGQVVWEIQPPGRVQELGLDAAAELERRERRASTLSRNAASQPLEPRTCSVSASVVRPFSTAAATFLAGELAPSLKVEWT